MATSVKYPIKQTFFMNSTEKPSQETSNSRENLKKRGDAPMTDNSSRRLNPEPLLEKILQNKLSEQPGNELYKKLLEAHKQETESDLERNEFNKENSEDETRSDPGLEETGCTCQNKILCRHKPRKVFHNSVL